MADSGLERLRAAAVYIRSPDGITGSGYLVARQRIGTALHVVRSWQKGTTYEVLIGTGGARRACKARLLATDARADAAVLGFDEALAAQPLPVARVLDRRATWIGYGFPGVASRGEGAPQGLPLDGHVQDPNAPLDDESMAVLLYSEMIAAGRASPLHGFSGGPVVVDGALIGHLVRHIGDPEDRQRAAFGYVYACPIAAVVALLEPDRLPQAMDIQPKTLPTFRDAIPDIAGDGYHVFVSYRSTERDWALSLVDRLAGAGLRVFFDQRSLEPGDYLPAQIEAALQRSRAAVVLVSRGWIASPWCQQEANVLVKRAVEDATFTLVPLRLDDCEMPALLGSRLWLDFEGTTRPAGPELERLLKRLVGGDRLQADAIAEQAAAAARKVSDEFVARIHDAAIGYASRIDALLTEWRKTASTDVAPLLAAADVLIGKGEFERAQQVLKGLEASLRVRQLRAFALSKEGDDAAIELLEALAREGHRDAETLGLLAGSHKRRWRRTRDRASALRAYTLYREAFERFGDCFNGINTAAMALQCDQHVHSVQVATQVASSLTARPIAGLDRWELASLAEALLLLGKLDEARERYMRAVALTTGRHQDIAVMRRQARMDLAALGRPEGLFDDQLPVPGVLAYFGHMIDAPDRPKPRFPAARIQQVRGAIAERIARGPVHGFGCAASGSDLVFLEELIDGGCTATVVLPFPARDFAATSVDADWRYRFEAALRAPGITLAEPLLPHRPDDAELPQAFAATNREILRRATRYARALDETPMVCAVWDGHTGDGAGGTADAVALWRERGFTVDIIRPLDG